MVFSSTRSLFVGSLASPLRLRRFIPPWELDGKTADAFFAGLMTSNNPVHAARRNATRTEAELNAMEDTASPAELQRVAAVHAHNAEIAARRRDFLPYGSTPRVYFSHKDMAALGEYEAMLHAAGGSYSPATRDLLRADLEQKIPYRYDTCVPLRGSQAQWPLHGTVGIVLDIDGVVYRSHKLINGSDAAIRKAMELRIPLLFMTNGGGLSEAEKAKELSDLIGCEIAAEQVLLGHTPMQLLSAIYRDDEVLIIGGGKSADVAKSYGFHRAKSVLQYQAEHPELVPFKKWGELKTCEKGSVPFPEIAAIIEFHEPEDMLNDAQTIIDILLAPKGRVGRIVSSTQCVPYYISADDLLWATDAPLPRMGQGACREMVSSVFESITGNGLQVQIYGKPRAIAYAFAERRMEEVSARLGWDPQALRAIFMVGDNIDTDIIGANAFGGRWTSVHVLTGIGTAPAATRTLSVNDSEMEWLESHVSKTPHYVAPTLDHFFRELLAFPEEALLQNKRPYYGMPNPVNLQETYCFQP